VASTQVAFPLLSRDDAVQPVEPHLGSILSSGNATVDIYVQAYPAMKGASRLRPAAVRQIAANRHRRGFPRRREDLVVNLSRVASTGTRGERI
jgi:hypothetical protein